MRGRAGAQLSVIHTCLSVAIKLCDHAVYGRFAPSLDISALHWTFRPLNGRFAPVSGLFAPAYKL